MEALCARPKLRDAEGSFVSGEEVRVQRKKNCEMAADKRTAFADGNNSLKPAGTRSADKQPVQRETKEEIIVSPGGIPQMYFWPVFIGIDLRFIFAFRVGLSVSVLGPLAHERPTG